MPEPRVSAKQVIDYVTWRLNLEALSNEQLAMVLLAEAPVMSRLGNIVEIVAERLSPGVIERMANGVAEESE